MSTNPLLSLTSADLKKAAALQARIEQMQARLAALIGLSEKGQPGPKGIMGSRRTVSAARRRRLSAIAKARWKKAKAAGKSSL